MVHAEETMVLYVGIKKIIKINDFSQNATTFHHFQQIFSQEVQRRPCLTKNHRRSSLIFGQSNQPYKHVVKSIEFLTMIRSMQSSAPLRHHFEGQKPSQTELEVKELN